MKSGLVVAKQCYFFKYGSTTRVVNFYYYFMNYLMWTVHLGLLTLPIYLLWSVQTLQCKIFIIWRIRCLKNKVELVTLWALLVSYVMGKCHVRKRFFFISLLLSLILNIHQQWKRRRFHFYHQASPPIMDLKISGRFQKRGLTRCWRGNWPRKKIHWPWDTYFLKRNDMGDNVY